MPDTIVEEFLMCKKDRTTMFMFAWDFIIIQKSIQFLSIVHHLSSTPLIGSTSEYHGQLAIVNIQPWPLKVIPLSSTNDGQLAFTNLLTPSTSYDSFTHITSTSMLYPFTRVNRNTVRSFYSHFSHRHSYSIMNCLYTRIEPFPVVTE